MYYEIDIPNELYELAKSFDAQGSTLYVVGGYVRNSLLGIKNTDIDICADLDYEKAMKISTKLGYRSQLVNKNLGTVLIVANDKSFEYTQFRCENYRKGGSHTPESVSFVKDIKVDASRRDLTINALYYDILGHNILDFYNGMKDLRCGRLRAVDSPQKVFASDGLRILRLIRFASILDYKIEKNTKRYAKKYLSNLKDITKPRIVKELHELVYNKYNAPHCVSRAVKDYNHWHIWDQILGIKNIQPKVYDYDKVSLDAKYDLLLYSLVDKFVSKDLTAIDYYIHHILGKGGLQESNQHIDRVKHILIVTRLVPNKLSTIKYMQLDDISKEILKIANPSLYQKFENIKCDILNQKLPISKSDLAITASEIASIIGSENKISYVQELLLTNMLLGNLENTHSSIVEALNNIKDKL